MKLLVSSITAFHVSWLQHGGGRLASRRFLGKASRDEELSSFSGSENGDTEYSKMQQELEHITKLERLLSEIKGLELEHDLIAEYGDEQEEEDFLWDAASLNDFLGSITSDHDNHEDTVPDRSAVSATGVHQHIWGDVERFDGIITESYAEAAARGLEKALLQGVVPVSTTIGSETIPGDFGFDPLGMADRDLFLPTQQFILNLLPNSRWGEDDGKDANHTPPPSVRRPKALVLRDYRECEIRHGRICMLAAIIWPLQEMLDRFLLLPEEFGPLLSGPVTLPYFPLFMTFCMLMLGYLDIYSQAIKDMDRLGEAFLPGDCFWDPLRILDGASDRTKRIMQERELFNGRAAMIAVAAYFLEELFTHQPFIALESNALLLEPAYQIPFIQRWLDELFARNDPLFDVSLDIPDDVQTFLLDGFFLT